MNQRTFTLSSMNSGTAPQSAQVAGREFWEMLSRHPQAAPMKQIAKHIVLSATRVFQSESLAEYPARRLSYLTPNAPMSGAEARSAEASAPLAGWASAWVFFL